MCRTQCVLGLVALYVGLAHSWDVAVSQGDHLVFYTNGAKTDTVTLMSQNLTALVYDEVHNMMLYVDKQSDNDTICGYNLSSKEIKCFVERNGRNIHDLAFDPVTETLFFTDTKERSINWISLKPGSNNNRFGNLLIKMNDRTPTEIAVDSCRGYIYWTNTKIEKDEHMERARFNGSERKVTDTRFWNKYSLAIDPQTQKIYYFDGRTDGETYNLYLSSADLNSEYFNSSTEDVMLRFYGQLCASKVLTVSKDYIYWMNGSESYQSVWQLPKNGGIGAREINRLYYERPIGVATNYNVNEQIRGIQDCKALTSIVQNNSDGSSYVHSMKAYGQSLCNCTSGNSGEREDVSVCYNYCLQGNCSVNDEGLPKCRCNAGYSGERCEVYACRGYCLHNGDCSLNEEDDPVCQCADNHEGSRCEADKNDTFTFTNTSKLNSAKRNLTLADLLSSWRAPNSKLFVTINNNY